MRTAILILFVGISAWGSTMSAQEPSEPNQRFQEADLDSNGSLSRQEFIAYVSEKLPDFRQFDSLMDRLDEDNDQKLSPAEFENRRKATQELIASAPVEFADGFNTRYAKQSPRVGETLGALVAFDEQGNQLDFESLKGKYTVFNFGCLT